MNVINMLQILVDAPGVDGSGGGASAVTCDANLLVLINIVKIFLNGVRYVIPIILIVIGTVDLAKAVLAKDDEATKKEQKHLVTRVIYAVVIFLIPTIVILLFNVLGKSTTDDYAAESGFSWKNWAKCWNK